MADIAKAELADQNLKKHVAAIHIENRLSLLERKMANVLLFNAYPELLTRETHRIRVKDLADTLGFDSNDQDCLKKALVNLMSIVVTWNILDGKGNERVWRARPMLMAVDIERTWCSYGYHKDLRQQLFNPEIYSRINLGIQRKFTSGHALSLYENCLRYRSIGSTGWWALETFRKLMGVDDNDYYADFRRLNSKVIKPAVKQVNTASDILLTAEKKSEKRRVVAIRFLIEENPQMPLLAIQPHPMARAPENAAGGGELTEALRARLLDFGLRENEAERALKEHDAAYISENLEIVAEMLARGAIKKTLRAATLDALRADYRPSKAPFEVDQGVGRDGEKKTLEERERRARRREELERLRREFDRHRLQAALARLTVEERDALKERFETAHRGNPIFRKCFAKGYEHPIIQSLFRAFAGQQLLDEFRESEFEAFGQAQAKRV